MSDLLWVFTVSKIYEFLDTYIMILRKKDEQVTFLHVYHHASIYVIWWINLKHSPGGEAYQSAAMNSIVHVVMYTYYLLRTVAPNGNYWWKRYITQMQIIQFVLFVGQGIALLYYSCVSFSITLLNELYAWSLLGLFLHFYFDGYIRKPRDRITLVANKQQQGGSKKRD
jgi:elongation of very long chain fatty acids protein 4